MGCLTGSQENVPAQTTEDLEGVLVGFFNIPRELWPSGFRMTRYMQEQATEEVALVQALAHKLLAEIGKVSRFLVPWLPGYKQQRFVQLYLIQ